MNTREVLLNRIRNKGYWNVAIRPAKAFYQEDYFKLEDLDSVIRKTQIRHHGGRYFPYIPISSLGNIMSNSNESIFCMFDDNAQGDSEVWQFARNGQFQYIGELEEDYVLSPERKKAILERLSFYSNLHIENIELFLEVETLVWKITEIFAFASEMAQLDQFNNVTTFNILIELHKVNERTLFIWDERKFINGPYTCHFDSDVLRFEKEYNREQLIGSYEIFAFEVIKSIYISFDWKHPNENMILANQKEFLGKE